ncbi:hypothetical protein ACIHFD_49230 [Nonomuraea sp. NPDC051941]|uniref:hypothetical protein n=1 Tax=Nonomuraea sp. NPDC051941 TaxID=3364373 RepID=UPI0037CBFE27
MSDQHPPRDDERHLTVDDLSGAQVGHIAFSNVASILAEECTMLVPTAAHRRRGTAGLTRSVVELRRKLNELLARAITTDLLDGADWPDIAKALGMDPDLVSFNYEHLDWRDIGDDPRAVWEAFRPSCVSQLHDSCSDDPAETARQLDRWYRDHADPREAAPIPAQAVTAGL